MKVNVLVGGLILQSFDMTIADAQRELSEITESVADGEVIRQSWISIDKAAAAWISE